MTSALVPTSGPLTAVTLENVLVNGDLAKLSAEQRLAYYTRVCESVGLNPLTQPFAYIMLNGRLTLYAKRDATDQIRANKNVSVTITARERHDDIYVVTARATTPDGRTDESIGAVSIASLKGESLANALMKAETKAKRRVTLSIGGLGWLDETEVGSIPRAQHVEIDARTGDFIEHDASGVGRATQQQVGRIHQLARELGWPEARYRDFLQDSYEVESSTDLTVDQAESCIGLLEAERERVAAEHGSGEAIPFDDDVTDRDDPLWRRYLAVRDEARTKLPDEVLATLPLTLQPPIARSVLVEGGKSIRKAIDDAQTVGVGR